MSVLVTGASGLLGKELCNHLKRNGVEVIEWDLPDNDITDVNNCINRLHRVNPAVIFHLAAWTDVDGCEENPAKAMAVNFHGTWAMALGATELNCKLLYVSTDYVFDGRARRAYRESDKPNPLSVYGKSKLMGEVAVRKNCRRWFIVRTSGIFGRYGKNFVDTIRHKALAEGVIKVVNDQITSPTYTGDLCEPLAKIANSEYYGIYHLTNSGFCSWYDFAREIVRLIGAECEIVPISTVQSGRRALRPVFSVLENRNYQRRFGVILRGWEEALRSYLNDVPATQTGG